MNAEPIRLKGMTWNHSRGYTPMVATAQRYSEIRSLAPGSAVEVAWQKRSLQEFADQPIDALAKEYDLLVIDHPWVGFGARSGVLVPLDQYVSQEILLNLSSTAGKSFESYQWDGHQWAFAIDAAAPVSAYRPDLLERHGIDLPTNWNDLIALARRELVALPSIPLDTFCNFVNLCASLEGDLFQSDDRVASREYGREALERLRELQSYVADGFFLLNPIGTLEMMGDDDDDFAYCPFTYGYSNYARPGFGARLVRFGGIFEIKKGVTPSTMLGGTGLAVSSHCKDREAAVRFAHFVASPEIQRGIYFQSGGQPAHRSAWMDATVNAMSSNYFRDTLPTLDAAFLRPRYDGFLAFQDRAGGPIWRYLREGGNANHVLDELDALYRKHRGPVR